MGIIGSKIAIFIGALFAIVGTINVMASLYHYYQIATDAVYVSFDGIPKYTWSSTSIELAQGLVIAAIGISLLLMANRSKQHKHALAKLGANPELDCWFVDDNTSEPIEARLYLNSEHRTLSVISNSQQELYSTSLDSETARIKGPLTFRFTALYITDGTRNIALGFTKDPQGLKIQKRNFIIAMLFSWPGEAASITALMLGGGLKDSTVVFGGNIVEYNHRWFKHYKIPSYKSRLSTGELGMLLFVGIIPAFFIVVVIIGIIVNLFN